MEPFKAAIDVMLTESTTAPRKQRHTSRWILARLIEEHGAEAEADFGEVWVAEIAGTDASFDPASLEIAPP